MTLKRVCQEISKTNLFMITSRPMGIRFLITTIEIGTKSGAAEEGIWLKLEVNDKDFRKRLKKYLLSSKLIKSALSEKVPILYLRLVKWYDAKVNEKQV